MYVCSLYCIHVRQAQKDAKEAADRSEEAAKLLMIWWIWLSLVIIYWIITLWPFNIAMENGPFIDGLPGFTYKKWWFSMAMLNNQRVYVKLSKKWLTKSIYCFIIGY